MSEFSPYSTPEILADLTLELPANYEPYLFIEAIESQYGLAVRQVVDGMSEKLVYSNNAYPEAQQKAFSNEICEYDENGAVSLSGRRIIIPHIDDTSLQAEYSNRHLGAELSCAEATDINRYATQWDVSLVRRDDRFKTMVPIERVTLRYDSYLHKSDAPTFGPWVGIQSPAIEGGFATVNLNGDTVTGRLSDCSDEYNRAITNIMQTFGDTVVKYL